MGEAKCRQRTTSHPTPPEFVFRRHLHCEAEARGECVLCGDLMFQAGDRSQDGLKAYVASIVEELQVAAQAGLDLSFFMAPPVGVEPSPEPPSEGFINAWAMNSMTVGFTVSPNGDVTCTDIEATAAGLA